MKTHASLLAGGLAAGLCVAQPALAQKPTGLPGNYPNKPIKVVIGASPGGGTDILGRLVFKYVAEAWDHPFVIENKTSIMGSAMALDEVSKSPPDGYTYNVVSGSTYIGAAVVHEIPKNLMKVLDPVAQFTTQPFLMVAPVSMPANTVPQLVELLKKNPGKYNYASSGLGGSAYLAAEYFKHEFGNLQVTHVPYKGIGPAYVDLIAGRTHFSFGTSISAIPHVRSGKLKLLAVTSSERVPSLPDTPAMKEFLPDFEYISFYGLVGPAGTPRPVVMAMNKTINDVLLKPEVAKPLEADGSEVVRTSPEGFQKTLNGFVARVQKLVKEAKLDLKPKK
jgi:tripartite-type tricarboxylate transporter receptor subunit TctC